MLDAFLNRLHHEESLDMIILSLLLLLAPVSVSSSTDQCYKEHKGLHGRNESRFNNHSPVVKEKARLYHGRFIKGVKLKIYIKANAH